MGATTPGDEWIVYCDHGESSGTNCVLTQYNTHSGPTSPYIMTWADATTVELRDMFTRPERKPLTTADIVDDATMLPGKTPDIVADAGPAELL